MMNEKIKLLVVDDSPHLLAITTDLLKTTGYDVLQASTGRQCLQIMEEEHPDLILLDVVLPDINGIEVCKQIKASSDAHVILVSAHEKSSEIQAQGLEAGADGFVTRPIEARELFARIQAMLRIRNVQAELRNAHKALQGSEQKYRTLVESISEGLLQVDHDDVIQFVNDRFCEMFGYSREELLGKTGYRLLLPEESWPIIRDKNQARKLGISDVYELQMKKKTGQMIWCENAAAPAVDSNGTTTGSLAVIADITARRRTEIRNYAFSVLGKRLNSAQNAQEAAKIILDTADNLLGWDSCSFDLYSEEMDKVVHVLAIDTIGGERKTVPPVYQGAPSPVARRTIQDGPFLLSGKKPDLPGMIRFGDTSRPSSSRLYVPIRSSSKVIGILTIQSYSENAYQKEDLDTLLALADYCGGALERLQAEGSLRESEERYRNVVKHSQGFICTHDLSGIILSVNPAASALLGYPPSQMVGKNLAQFMTPGAARLFQDYLQLMRRQGSASGLMNVLTKDGQERILLYRSVFVEETSKAFYVLVSAQDTTERVYAERALRVSEERFELASKAANDALWDWDMSTNRVWRNEGFQKLFGYKAEAIESDQEWWKNHVHADDLSALMSGIHEFLDHGGESWFGEYRFRRANGSYAYIYDRGYLIRDADGKPSRMIGAMMDITARKEAAEALARSVSVLNAALESTADGILVVDRKGKIVNFNRKFVEIWSIPESILASRDDKRALRFVTDQLRDPDSFLSKVKELYSSPEAESYDLLEFRDGRMLERYSQPQRIDGISVGRVWSFRDITQRKKGDELLRRSEEKYRALFENSRDPVFISTPEGRLLDVNRAGYELLGYSSKEELMRIDVAAFYAEPADRIEYQRVMSQYGYVKDYELTLKRKDGTKLAVLETSSVARDTNGNIVSYEGALRDITKLKQLQQQLLQSQKIETIGQLAGGVAHDFNNILMAISGYCELLHLKLSPEDPRSRDVDEIYKASQQGASLTNQLLAFSRKQVLAPKVLDLNILLVNMKNLLQRLIGEDIEMMLDLEQDLGRIKADSGQVEQAIMNLAVNSRDAMPVGGKLRVATANVTLDEEYTRNHLGSVPGPSVMLAITDNGCGMDETTVSHIFEPFFTTKEQGKGTGLGLSTVYGIVKQNGGYIWVESQSGRGTTFQIFFPRIDHPAEAMTEPATVIAPHGSGETILLVDDNDSLRSAVGTFLSMNGYNVLQAIDGHEAMNVAQEHQGTIHLLMTDVVMPKMSGRELVEVLQPRHSEMKVLYMSGYTKDAVIRQGILDTEVNFLQKPASMTVLQKKIREILSGDQKT
jgi:PAS domain S-box-containing protein